jgi:antitoxin (DNA-binding transcriptional repressor) of toxin-antitoxin stability system
MAATASIRDLRNRFPIVKKLVDEEGEVLVTDRGTPTYRLTRYTRARTTPPARKDYLARLRQHQPDPLDPAAAQALDEANRGER